jgi:hypothetical protein
VHIDNEWGLKKTSIFRLLSGNSVSANIAASTTHTDIAKLSFIAEDVAIKELLMRMFTQMFTQLCSFYRRFLCCCRSRVLPDGKVLNFIRKNFSVCIVTE